MEFSSFLDSRFRGNDTPQSLSRNAVFRQMYHQPTASRLPKTPNKMGTLVNLMDWETVRATAQLPISGQPLRRLRFAGAGPSR